MKQELLKGLSEEQIAKVKACQNSEDLLVLAKEEGVELTDEQLEAVSGGCTTPVEKPIICESCHSDQVEKELIRTNISSMTYCTCKACGHKWIL